MTMVNTQVSADLYLEITNLLNQEAFCLDNGMYKEWLELTGRGSNVSDASP